MDNNNDTIEDINNSPYVIAFKIAYHCVPIHNFIVNMIAGTIVYYCGLNNTITLPLDYIYSKMS